jgi:hypothetical protein
MATKPYSDSILIDLQIEPKLFQSECGSPKFSIFVSRSLALIVAAKIMYFVALLSPQKTVLDQNQKIWSSEAQNTKGGAWLKNSPSNIGN